MEELGGCAAEGRDDHSMEGLRQQLEKLGKFWNQQNSKSTNKTDVPFTEQPVDELVTKLSKLGGFHAGINRKNNRTSKESTSSKDVNPIECSVEELCENVAKMWKSEPEVGKLGHKTANKTEPSRNECIPDHSGKESSEQPGKQNCKEENSNLNSFKESLREDQKEAFVFVGHPFMNTSPNVFPSVVPTGKDDVFDFLNMEKMHLLYFLAH